MPIPQPRPTAPRSTRTPRARPLTAPERNRRLAREMLGKVGLNLLLIAGGLVAVMQLLPYYIGQKEKLDALELAHQDTQRRVEQLQAEISQDKHPQARTRIAQEEANLIRPDQRRVIWLKPETGSETSPETSNVTPDNTPQSNTVARD